MCVCVCVCEVGYLLVEFYDLRVSSIADGRCLLNGDVVDLPWDSGDVVDLPWDSGDRLGCRGRRPLGTCSPKASA